LPQNFSQNIVRPVLHFVVPESQRTKSALGEHGAAHRIELDSVSMPTTIDFDDEAGRNTDEVDNVAVDGNLSAKLNQHRRLARKRVHNRLSASVWRERNVRALLVPRRSSTRVAS